MGTTVVTLCGLCGKPVEDFFYNFRTNEGDKALCLECAGANTIQQLSDIGFIDAPEEIADASLYEADNSEEYPTMSIEEFRRRYPATPLSDEEIQNVLNGKNPDSTENKNIDPYWTEKYQ